MAAEGGAADGLERGAMLLAASERLAALNDAEQRRIARALDSWNSSVAVCAALLLVWVARSATLSAMPFEIAAAAAAACALLGAGLHWWEGRTIRRSKARAADLEVQIARVSREVSGLVAERKQKLEALVAAEAEAAEAAREALNKAESQVPAGSALETSSLLERSDSQRSTPRKSLLRRVFSRRRSRRDRSSSSNSSSKSGRRNSLRKSSIMRTMSMPAEEHARPLSGGESPIMRMRSAYSTASSVVSGDTAIESESESPSPAHATASRSFFEADRSEAVAEAQAEPLPAEPRLLDPNTPFGKLGHMRPEDITQPRWHEMIGELERRVADVATPQMVLKLGGPVRCYERFLLARNGKMAAAEKMFRESAQYRAERQLDNPTGERSKKRLESFRKFRHLWAGSFVSFTTNDGSPIQFFRFREINSRELLKQVTEEEFADFYVTWMELTLDLQNKANSLEHCAWLREQQLQRGAEEAQAQQSKAAGPPAGASTEGAHEWKGFVEIHDLAGVGRQQLYMPGVMMLTRVLKVGQGNYPENLRKAFICNAPLYFAAAWGVISRVLDSSTREKITVSRTVPMDELRELLTEEQIEGVFATRDPAALAAAGEM